MTAQDALISVTDSVLSRVIHMAPGDAATAVRKFPSRYSFVDPDPQTARSATAPSVTGSKGGNAALQSLLKALDGLGLVEDNTT